MSENVEKTETATPEPEAKARRQLVRGGVAAGIAGASVVGLGRKAWAGWRPPGGGGGGGSAGASAGHSR